MERTNRNYALVVPFVDSLVSLGLRHACITPGSRNTPLSLALADHPQVTDWSHHDERSAAFFALGIAKTTGIPAAVACTSGTAAAELLPAAVEARQARVPLLLLTADRPPELREVGAPQAIDQLKMYGTAVNWAHEVAPPEATRELLAYMVALAGRAWAAACDEPRGPVHLNLPFREPLVPEAVPGDVPDDLTPPAPPRYAPGRLAPDERDLAQIAGLLSGKRAIVVCGEIDAEDFPVAVTTLAEAGDFPVLADALSGVRAGGHDLARVVGQADPLARVGFLDSHPPEAVLRFGAPPTSTMLSRWLATHSETPQIVVDGSGWRDPGASAAMMLRSDPGAAALGLAKALGAPAPHGWAADWVDADRRAARALRGAVEAAGFPSEPRVVTTLADAMPAGATLWVASSMPIRDVDVFFPVLPKELRLLANRGANGIDGFISTGLGSAALRLAPTYLLTGDLSLLHDVGALATAARLATPATIVVLDNDGGGVFSFLPQAGYPQHFERHFATPHGLDLVALSEAFGVSAIEADQEDVLAASIAEPPAEPRLVLVRTDRDENVEVHQAAWAELERELTRADTV